MGKLQFLNSVDRAGMKILCLGEVLIDMLSQVLRPKMATYQQ